MEILKKLQRLAPKTALVIGSSCVEETYSLPVGISHQADATVTILPRQTSFGGAGLSNAIALQKTGVFLDITLVTAAGHTNGIPDADAASLAAFLQQQSVQPAIQHIAGPTEKTLMILSGSPNDKKRGFRLAGQDGSLIRDQFQIDSLVTEALQQHQCVIASSFDASKIIALAAAHKERHQESLFLWTMNNDAAYALRDDTAVQAALQHRLIDGAFLSQAEFQTILASEHAKKCLRHVGFFVVTNGEKGCTVYVPEQNISLFVRQHVVAEPVNDNGAGEAHHMHFFSSLLHLVQRVPRITTANSTVMLTAAAQIANYAALQKVSQADSLWFPKQDAVTREQALSKPVKYMLHTIANIPEDRQGFGAAFA